MKLLGDVEAVFELASHDVDEKIFEYLDQRSSVMMVGVKTAIESRTAKRVLAKYFSQYLTKEDIDILSKKK